MQGANDIRTAFLEYFRGHGHEVLASSPLVPQNDPTLLFTNAGHSDGVPGIFPRPRA